MQNLRLAEKSLRLADLSVYGLLLGHKSSACYPQKHEAKDEDHQSLQLRLQEEEEEEKALLSVPPLQFDSVAVESTNKKLKL